MTQALENKVAKIFIMGRQLPITFRNELVKVITMISG